MQCISSKATPNKPKKLQTDIILNQWKCKNDLICRTLSVYWYIMWIVRSFIHSYKCLQNLRVATHTCNNKLMSIYPVVWWSRWALNRKNLIHHTIFSHFVFILLPSFYRISKTKSYIKQSHTKCEREREREREKVK